MRNKIELFLDKQDNETSYFWDFLHSDGVYDAAIEPEEGDSVETFALGVALAQKAGSQPISRADIDKLSLFFIGTESQVMSRLKSKLKDFTKKNPDSPETQRLFELNKSEETLRKQIATLKQDTRRAESDTRFDRH